MKYYTYVLFSEKNGKTYIGSTQNLQNRLLQHNLGQSKSTKPYIPWKCIFAKEFTSRSDAFKYEKKLKSFKKRSRLLKEIVRVPK